MEQQESMLNLKLSRDMDFEWLSLICTQWSLLERKNPFSQSPIMGSWSASAVLRSHTQDIQWQRVTALLAAPPWAMSASPYESSCQTNEPWFLNTGPWCVACSLEIFRSISVGTLALASSWDHLEVTSQVPWSRGLQEGALAWVLSIRQIAFLFHLTLIFLS